ncbi:DUF3450 domain-containing protein [Parendozoicomonas haliclonae]|uniref:DUF3450 domain-containing protein n=1 Tax=Parendozoicomonas haliclonae TaxID=1960125 RepID=A0A1X7ANM9_9GAMM|nr:DUF3450 domain-containing protein [Parendozoicomonas haliclonae]SMA49931.1 hypothetical protein EHSB41UT_03722 [Parendozoicomonas haliclonae]
MTIKKVPLLSAALTMALLQPASLSANQVEAVLDTSTQTSKASQTSQKKIDNIADKTSKLLAQYKAVNKQIDGLDVYNARLQNQIDDQIKRLETMDQSIAQVTVIQRQIMPLIARMVDGLEQFIKLDTPFLEQERKERIAFLRANIDRSDLSTAEKFRQVLEAYKIENEYGRKIDSYTGTIAIDGQPRDVTFFRAGRVALLYQTTDGQITGAWDSESRSWQTLDSNEYRNATRQALRIARKQASIDILKLPISAPEAVAQ